MRDHGDRFTAVRSFIKKVHAGECGRAVILDGLIEDGGVQDCTMDWEEKIAAETYGWPQYIMAYV